MMWLNSATRAAVGSKQAQGAAAGASNVATTALPPTAGASTSSTTSTAVVVGVTGPVREGSTMGVSSDAVGSLPQPHADVSAPRPTSPRSLALENSAAAGAAAGAPAVATVTTAGTAGSHGAATSGHPHAHAHAQQQQQQLQQQQHEQEQQHSSSVARPRIASFMWLTPTRMELLKGDHRVSSAQHQQQQQQQQQQQKNVVAMAQAAMTIQCWYRHLREQGQMIRRVQNGLPAHLFPLLQASEGLGLGAWGWEWSALCHEERGLVDHAAGVLAGIGVELHCGAATTDHLFITQPETLLSALLIAAHPEVVMVVTPPSCSAAKKKRRRRGYGRKSVALARSATRVHTMLVELYYSLQQAHAPQWALLRIIRQTKHAVFMFAIQREHYRGLATAQTGGLVEELTRAVTDVLEAIARTNREMHEAAEDEVVGQQRNQQVLVACEEAIQEGVAKLSQLEEALEHLVGQGEAVRHMKMARQAAQQRLMEEEEGAMDIAEQKIKEVSINDDDKDKTSMLQVPPPLETKAPEDTLRGADGITTSPELLYSNEWLVHEICVLPQGRFLQVSLEDATATAGDNSSSATNPQQQQQDGGVEAYWASVTRTLLTGDYTPLLVLVQELGERLISITPSRGDLAEEVRGALDVALLEQVLVKDVLDSKLLFSMLRFAGERVLWLEAPARNESTEDWLEDLNNLEAEAMAEGGGNLVHLSLRGKDVASRDWAPLVSPLFEFLLEKVDQIHVDIFNSHVRRATPHCRAHGPAFERQRFEERLAQGQTSLDRTRAWLASVLRSEWCAAQTLSVKDYRYGIQPISLAEGLCQNREDALRIVVRRAYCAVLGHGAAVSAQAMGGYGTEVVSTTSPVLHECVLPETLAMDAQRLDVARRVLLCAARAATLVAYLGQAVGRSLGLAERQEILQGLMVLLPEDTVSEEDIRLHVGHLAVKLGLNDVGGSTKRQLEERMGHLLREGQCPVLRLLYERGVEVVHAILKRDGLVMGKEAQLELEQECRQRGLLGLESWMVKVSDMLLLVCRHNEAAFLSLYQKLALETAAVAEGKKSGNEDEDCMVLVVEEEK